ncbi:UNVERIFIED_CONTAM: hypothetical protein NCL1_46175, partial [Trichonephila clavipes]
LPTRWCYSISTSAPFNQSQKLPTWSPNIAPTCLYRQHFARFPLNRHYNRSLHKLYNNMLLLLSRDQLRKVFSKIDPQDSYELLEL